MFLIKKSAMVFKHSFNYLEQSIRLFTIKEVKKFKITYTD